MLGHFLYTKGVFGGLHIKTCLKHFFTIMVMDGLPLVAQMVKNLPAMQEIWVRSLGLEDPLEKGMVTQSSTLAWRIPWTEEPRRLQSMGLQKVGHN